MILDGHSIEALFVYASQYICFHSHVEWDEPGPEVQPTTTNQEEEDLVARHCREFCFVLRFGNGLADLDVRAWSAELLLTSLHKLHVGGVPSVMLLMGKKLSRLMVLFTSRAAARLRQLDGEVALDILRRAASCLLCFGPSAICKLNRAPGEVVWKIYKHVLDAWDGD